MNMKIWPAVAVALVAIVGAWFYMDGFTKVRWEEIEFDGIRGLCLEHRGHYKNVAKKIDKVASELNIVDNDELSFGVYFDDPKMTPEEQWRSYGCVSTEEEEKANLFAFSVDKKPRLLQSKFPFKHNLSIIMGVLKAYPALDRYCKKADCSHSGAIMEIYDKKSKTIRYVALPEDIEFRSSSSSSSSGGGGGETKPKPAVVEPEEAEEEDEEEEDIDVDIAEGEDTDVKTMKVKVKAEDVEDEEDIEKVEPKAKPDVHPEVKQEVEPVEPDVAETKPAEADVKAEVTSEEAIL